MERFNTGYKWLDKLMPEGLLIPSSTLISGPGGTGKPLIAFAFISSWLKSGGNIIMAPLQYPSPEFTVESMKKIYDIDLNEYKERVLSVNFDPSISFTEELGELTYKANLLKPEVWDEVIERAEESFDKSNLGTLLFGAALNLLFFSKTYADVILEKLRGLISENKTRSYLFTVSTSAFKEKIKVLEEISDNLIFSRMEKPMKLFLKIIRLKSLEFSSEEVLVPFSEDFLEEIKDIAESQRKRIIPVVSKI